MNLLKTCITIIGVTACFPVHSANAVVSTWKAVPVDNDWQTLGNWNNGVPGSADTATISNGANAQINAAVTNVSSLLVGGATSSQLTINSGGSLTVTGNGSLRISSSNTNRIGSLTVDGGILTGTGRLYLGLVDGTEATLTVKNGGIVNSGIVGLSNLNGQTSTMNIGGETVAAAPGWLNGTSVNGGAGGSGSAANTNTLNFNHTSTRYAFTKGSTSVDAVPILAAVQVNAKAGVTVLTGASTYSRGTTVDSGAVLLANYNTVSTTASSTGVGEVQVQSGGVLGGIGYVAGKTSIEGILRPGDYSYGAAVATHGILKFKDDLTLGTGSTTVIALDGTTRGVDYDAIDIAGIFSLGGTLKIDLMNNFSIALNQTRSFQLFNVTGSINGSFTDYDLPVSWNGLALQWDTTLISNAGTLSVNAIPEPSTVILLGLGFGIWLIARRRTIRS